MAWDYAAEIHNLTGFDADDTSTTATSGEVLSVHATQWLTDGARDIINVLSTNPEYVNLMSSVTTLNTSSSTLSLTNAKVGDVSLYDGTRLQGCRRISPKMRGRASDINDLMNYATTSDPVYWINAKTLETYPTPTDSNYVHATTLNYPSVSYNDSSISSFPDEVEHLVVLYASIKALQYQLNTIHTNTDITTAFTAINTELDETQAVCDLINTNVDNAVTEITQAITLTDTSSSDIRSAVNNMNTALGKFRTDGEDPALFGDENQYTTGVGLTGVQNALTLARDAIDTGFTTDEDSGSDDNSTPKSAGYWLNDEDSEMVTATINVAQTEISRAQSHIGEWNAIISALMNEANGFASEAKTRYGWINAKAVVWNGCLAAAQGFVAEVQTKINIAQGYLSESKIRMERDSQKYQWYQSQLQNLKQDYQQGIALLVGGGKPQEGK
jgi:hypothetical protein